MVASSLSRLANRCAVSPNKIFETNCIFIVINCAFTKLNITLNYNMYYSNQIVMMEKSNKISISDKFSSLIHTIFFIILQAKTFKISCKNVSHLTKQCHLDTR